MALNYSDFQLPLINLIASKALARTNAVKVANYSATDLDRNILCSGTFTVTLLLLTNLSHFENIDITNTGSGVITIATQGGELLYDVTTFDIFAGETLTVAKGSTSYIVK